MSVNYDAEAHIRLEQASRQGPYPPMVFDYIYIGSDDNFDYWKIKNKHNIPSVKSPLSHQDTAYIYIGYEKLNNSFMVLDSYLFGHRE